jgi:hypothetical protein
LLLPATFVREFFFPAAGASFRSASLSRRLAARRCCPRLLRRRGPQRLNCFRGSITRPQRSLSTLRSTPRGVATQDSLAAGGQPLLRGFLTRWAPFKVSAPHRNSSLPGFSWRNVDAIGVEARTSTYSMDAARLDLAEVSEQCGEQLVGATDETARGREQLGVRELAGRRAAFARSSASPLPRWGGDIFTLQ